MKRSQIRRDIQRAGFTLIEVMLASGVIAISTVALVAFTKISLDVDRKTRTKQNISQAKAEVISLLSNQDLWLNHVAMAGTAHPTLPSTTMNDDLACIRDRVACVDAQHPLTLMDSKSKIVVDPQVSTQGFTANGDHCNTFGDNTPGNTCTYRLELKWSPVCPAVGACVDPQVKVNITLKNYDSQTLTTNDLETLPYTLLTDTIKARAPVVKAFAIATNSAIYYPNESEINIDPLPYVFNDYKTNYTVAVDASETSSGNAISVLNNHIVYTPSASFYGLDNVQYTVTDQRSGLTTAAHVWVKVMTPYTWIGKANDFLASSNRNFCGKVVMGVCDSSTFPGGGHDKNLIFNMNCDSCTSEINISPISAIDMKSDFLGSVKLTSGVVVAADPYNAWKKIPLFHQGAGIFNGNDRSMIIVGNTWGYPWDHSQYAFLIDSGNSVFMSPNILKISGPASISNGNNFQHQNGKVTFYSFWGANYEVRAPGVHFYDVSFDDKNQRLGDPFGFNVTNDFFVHHNLYHNPYNQEGAISGRGTISLYGDIFLTGFGGAYNNYPGVPATISLVGTNDQTINGVAAPSLPVTLTASWQGKSLTAFLPFVKFNDKSTGSVIAKDWVGFEGLDVGTAPSFDTSAATFVFGIDSGTNVWRAGNFTYPDVYIVTGGSGCGDMLFDSDTIHISGNFYSYTWGCSHPYGKYDALKNATLDDSHSPTVIEVTKNFYLNGGFDHDKLDRSPTVKMVGTTNTVVQGNLSSVSAYNLSIEKKGQARVTMLGGYSTARSISSTIIDTMGSQLVIDPSTTIRVPAHGWNGMKSIFNIPGVQIHNLEIDHGFVLASDLQVENLTWGSHGGGNYSLSLNPLSGTDHVFNLTGNLNIESGLPYGGTPIINMLGGTDSDINTTSPSRLGIYSTKLNIMKSGMAAVNFKSPDILGGYNYYGTEHISNSVLTVSPSSTLNVIGGTLKVGSLNFDPSSVVVNYSAGGKLCSQANDYAATVCHTAP